MSESENDKAAVIETVAKPLAEVISKPQNLPYEDFAKLDIRAGIIMVAEVIQGSKKLLKLEVFFGLELGNRIVVAGIAEGYQPADLPGQQVVAVLNIAPRTMMGITSEAMLLAGRSPSGRLLLVNPHGIMLGGEIG
jgi:methionyl-tRNA synthetase